MNNFEKKPKSFDPIEGFEKATEVELYQEGDNAVLEIEKWLDDNSGELFLALADNKDLKVSRFEKFQQDFNKLKSLFDEVKELKDAVEQIENDDTTKQEVEKEIFEKAKILEEQKLFIAKEYMDVINPITEEVTE